MENQNIDMLHVCEGHNPSGAAICRGAANALKLQNFPLIIERYAFNICRKLPLCLVYFLPPFLY